MILIVGCTHDDILYFENVLTNKKEETILNRYKMLIGNIATQEVGIIYEQYSTVLASAVVSNVLTRHYIDLVVNVGRCIGGSPDCKSGDIAISSRIIDANIDLSDIKEGMRWQIPGFSRDMLVQNDVIGYLRDGINRRTFVTSYTGVFLSSNNLSPEVVEFLKGRKAIFGIKDEKILIDNNSSGVALAATLRNVPFVSFKVVENRLDKDNNIDSYINVLNRYIDLGKAVVSMISDIGRNDILR